MNRVYLLSNRELDRAFGFKTEMAMTMQRIGMSPQEGYIRDLIEFCFKDEHYNPKVEEVFVVNKINDKGLVGRVNVHTDKKLYANNVSPRINAKIRLDGKYLDELRKYLLETGEYDKIIIAPTKIAREIKKDVSELIGEVHLRAAIHD